MHQSLREKMKALYTLNQVFCHFVYLQFYLYSTCICKIVNKQRMFVTEYLGQGIVGAQCHSSFVCLDTGICKKQ